MKTIPEHPTPRDQDGRPPAGEPGSLEWLVEIMRRLLAPDGCPWDREQTLESLERYLLEETYELLEAIDEGDPSHHREELGDLMFQVVFQAALAGHPMREVIRGIGDKLVRRHPHVFGQLQVEDSGQVRANWEAIKQQENGGPRPLLEGVPRALPALQRAHKITARAARVGFDWPAAEGARQKLAEELAELDAAAAGGQRQAMDHELGDLLLAVVNWARKLGLDPEQALARANRRFERRFAHVEQGLSARGLTPQEASLEEMDALWNEAKEES